MMETNRKRMGDDGSFDGDGDVTNVADQFSDEIVDYDAGDIVDISIADDAPNEIKEHKIISIVKGDTEDSSENNSNRSDENANDTTKFVNGLGLLFLGIAMVAVFLMGILIGSTHSKSKNGIGSTHGKSTNGSGPPSTMGNPSLSYYGPSVAQRPPTEQGPIGNHGSILGADDDGHNVYGDFPQNNYHQGPPSAEEEYYQQRKRHFTTLSVEWSGAAAVATPLSPSRRALDWILDEDPFQLTTLDRTLDVQQRYVMACFYFATLGEHWAHNRRLSQLERTQNRTRGGGGRRRRLQNSHQDLHKSNNDDGGFDTHNGERHTDDNSDAIANFLTSRDVCQWSTSAGKSGVFCDENGTIVRLEFRDFGLGGTLPREFGTLGNLHSINLEYNDIEGTLPTHYGLLVNLHTLKFENNLITGRIPRELANLQKLEKLDLDGNNFTGQLPTELAGLRSIVKIEIAGSTLQGSIPTELANLNQTLQKIDFQDNKFSGNLPTALGSLTKLTYLDLENNLFSGTIPVELGAANSLIMLYLNGNNLAGNLDVAFCNTDIHLFEFVADCQGSTPEVKCGCCTSCCNTKGSNCTVNFIAPLTDHPDIPQTETNTETGTLIAKPAFPPTFAPQTTTSTVDSSKLKQVLATVSDTSLLEAKHTDQFKTFMWMTRLDPSPLDMDSTPHHIILQKYIMALLYVSTNGKEWHNQRSFLSSANVCDWMGVVCNNEEEIESINLENNNLTGTLVSEIGALGPSLRELQFTTNMLHGQLPSELGLLTGLTKLDVFDNKDINGTIPAELSIQFLPNIEKIQLVGTGIVGDLDPLFCTDDTTRDISANCFGPSVICTCCKVCCDANGDNCQVFETRD